MVSKARITECDKTYDRDIFKVLRNHSKTTVHGVEAWRPRRDITVAYILIGKNADKRILSFGTDRKRAEV